MINSWKQILISTQKQTNKKYLNVGLHIQELSDFVRITIGTYKFYTLSNVFLKQMNSHGQI